MTPQQQEEQGTVTAVSSNGTYAFSKPVRDEIVLIAGVGVAGDVHAGVYVKHRGRVRADPTQPNLRQVHLIPQEIFDEVGMKGYAVTPGDLGENVTTRGINLFGLPRGTIIRFGRPPAAPIAGEAQNESLSAVLAVAAATSLDPPIAAAVSAVAAAAERDTGEDPRPAVILAGLRNPCAQINTFQEGLLKEVLGRDDEGRLIRKAGVMGVVLRGGAIRPGDPLTAELPPPPRTALDRV